MPHRLRDLPEPPGELYLRGELPRGPAVAVVGTRVPTLAALRFAEGLAHDLARAGVAVLSGGAQGIDTACHEGALRAHGVTVVVAPAGFDRPFPAGNRNLFQRVVDGRGAYLSLVPDGIPAATHAFFARNACLVALAHVVVVVEAPFRSGARNAARWARQLGRSLLVVPHAPWNERGRGSLLELRGGARLCEDARDVFSELERLLLQPISVPNEPAAAQLALGFDPSRAPASCGAKVTWAVQRGAVHLDQVCEFTGLSAADAQREILTLTLDGVLAPDASGRLAILGLPSAPVDADTQILEIADETEAVSEVASCAMVNKPET